MGGVEGVTARYRPSGTFSLYQNIKFAGVYRITNLASTPDYGDFDLRHRAGIMYDRVYQQGEDVIENAWWMPEIHLLVDRLSCNFSRAAPRGHRCVWHGRNRDP